MALGLYQHRIVRWHTALPAVGDEIVGHRANRIGRAAKQVDTAIAIKIHRPARPAGGHELRHPHGTGVAAAQRKRVLLGARAQAEELLQLALEKGLAFGGPGMGAGEVKRQRGQGVHHTEVAHVLAVERLHAQDAHDDLCWHAVFAFGPRQGGSVGLPKAQPGTDANGLDETAAVGLPIFGLAFGGGQHQTGHARQKTRLANRFAHPGRIKVTPRRYVIGKQHGFGTVGVGAAGGRWCCRACWGLGCFDGRGRLAGEGGKSAGGERQREQGRERQTGIHGVERGRGQRSWRHWRCRGASCWRLVLPGA